MIRGTPQARITNQGVKPVSEGKDARVAGASVTYAAIRYRNAAKAARAGLLLSAAAAWHPLWLKWRASLGEVFQAAKRFGFALSQGNQSHTLAGEMLKEAERLRREDYTSMPWRKTAATDPAAAPAE